MNSILCIRKRNTHQNFPESFEWMILKSGILRDSSIDEILTHPEDFVDNREYISWERFFTALLQEKTAEDSI